MEVIQFPSLRPIQNPVHLFTAQHGVLHLHSLQRRLVYYRQQSGVPVTAQRLRHTFASQMLTAGMPVFSLQRYLVHEHLDTTMIYDEVSDPMLRQDYCQGIKVLEAVFENLSMSGLAPNLPDTLRELVGELKALGLETALHDEILEQMQRLLETDDKKIENMSSGKGNVTE